MTPQEESMLNDLIGRIEQTQLTEKDPDAEQLLNQRLGRNPNALYILAQTVLVQNYALEQAQAQLNQLRQQSQALQQQPARSTSFLGSLLGLLSAAPPAEPSAAGRWGRSLAVLITSIGFAMVHSEQLGQAWGPLLV